MCSPIRCRKCNKTTWSGCGSHIAQVKAGIPPEQWCDGHNNDKKTTSWFGPFFKGAR